MVIKNCTTNVTFGPRQYRAPGSNGETYDVIHWHDDTWTCVCAHFEQRIKYPVVDLTFGCKHMRNAANGDYGKPRVRCSHRPVAPPKPVRAWSQDQRHPDTYTLDI